MFPRFYPPAATNCSNCREMGYIVRPRGEFAQAEICACVPECSRCGGNGRMVIERDGARQIGRCRCQKLPDRIRIFNTAHIPARHARSSFVNFEISDASVIRAFGEAQKWVAEYTPGEENKGMIFWGMVGRGKTHLLVATLRSLVFTHGVQVRFVEFSRLLSTLKEGYSTGRSDTPLLTELSSIPVLGVDELGKGRLSEWELTIIDEVVSRRYNAMGTLLGSTNYRPADPTGAPPPNLAKPEFERQTLGDRVGWRVFSRLKQMSMFVQTRGQDYRSNARSISHARLTTVPNENAG